MFSIMVRALAMLQESECFVQGCILVQGSQPKNSNTVYVKNYTSPTNMVSVKNNYFLVLQTIRGR